MKRIRRFYPATQSLRYYEGFRDLRQEMIDETNQFLSGHWPRIRAFPGFPLPASTRAASPKFMEATGSRNWSRRGGTRCWRRRKICRAKRVRLDEGFD